MACIVPSSAPVSKRLVYIWSFEPMYHGSIKLALLISMETLSTDLIPLNFDEYELLPKHELGSQIYSAMIFSKSYHIDGNPSKKLLHVQHVGLHLL